MRVCFDTGSPASAANALNLSDGRALGLRLHGVEGVFWPLTFQLSQQLRLALFISLASPERLIRAPFRM